VVSLVPGQQRSLEQVKKMRQELSNELMEVINEFAPKLYKDFDQVSFVYHATKFTNVIWT
jgi:glycerol-3-phosphate O-acyltransferase / dihydroxyacetone phosphate acyltransferase